MTSFSRLLPRAPALVLTLAFGLIPALAPLVPLSVVPVCAIATGLLAVLNGWRLPRPSVAPAVILGGLVLWGFISTAWSLDAAAALSKAGGLLGALIVWSVFSDAVHRLPPPDRGLVRGGLVAGMTVGVILLTGEFASGGRLFAALSDGQDAEPIQNPLQFLNRGAAIIALLAPTTLVSLHATGRRWLAAAAAVGLFLLLFFLDKQTLRLALAAAVLAALAAALARRATTMGLAILLAAIVMAMPTAIERLPSAERVWTDYRWVPTSLNHRILIWKFTLDHVRERPLTGWGLQSSRFLPGGDQDVPLERSWSDGRIEPVVWRRMPLHPHNVPLQIWAELGGVGAVLTAILAAVAARATAFMRRPERIAAAATLGMVAVVSCSSFGAWQSWWLFTQIVAATALSLEDHA